MPHQQLAQRLRQMAKDSANTTMTVLNLFAGIRGTKRTREEFSTELKKTIEQVQRLNQAWKRLEEHLVYLEAQTNEANEQEVIKIVEELTDTVLIVENDR